MPSTTVANFILLYISFYPTPLPWIGWHSAKGNANKLRSPIPSTITALKSMPMYMVHLISFQTFFVQAFKIVIDSWKFSMLLLYILWDDWPIFMISGSNEQLQQKLEYTLLKPDCHSWWISKIQSDTLEERYAIKFCFKLGKNATETYGMLQTAFRPSCMNWAISFWVA